MSTSEKYKKVLELRAKNPGLSIEKAAKQVSMAPSAFYYHQSREKPKAKKKPATVKASYQRVVAAPTSTADSRMLAVFGSPTEILAFANEVLK